MRMSDLGRHLVFREPLSLGALGPATPPCEGDSALEVRCRVLVNGNEAQALGHSDQPRAAEVTRHGSVSGATFRRALDPRMKVSRP
jgi:hypothetical protein